MSEPAHAELPEPNPLEREVDEAIAVCGGDVRAALRTTLVANAFLEAELERLTQAVSSGYTRGKITPTRQASEKLEEWREISSSQGIARKSTDGA